jgi:hypothetical protein
VPANLPAITKSTWRSPMGCELFHARFKDSPKIDHLCLGLAGRATLIISATGIAADSWPCIQSEAFDPEPAIWALYHHARRMGLLAATIPGKSFSNSRLQNLGLKPPAQPRLTASRPLDKAPDNALLTTATVDDGALQRFQNR